MQAVVKQFNAWATANADAADEQEGSMVDGFGTIQACMQGVQAAITKERRTMYSKCRCCAEVRSVFDDRIDGAFDVPKLSTCAAVQFCVVATK